MDDVLYLKQHADEESFLFVVDSARRDTAVHPQPNEYEVQFKAPFRNVVGVDLVDATVPRTEYIVEDGANTLAYTYGGTRRTATVEPGDYTLVQLAEALTAALAGGVSVQPVTAPVEVSNKVRFLADAALTVHPGSSGLRRSLGLGLEDLVATAVPGALGEATLVAGPLPVQDVVALDAPVRQAFTAAASGSLARVDLYVTSAEAVSVDVAVLAGATLVATGAAATTGVDFEQVSVTLDGPITAGETYHVVLRGAGASVFCEAADVSTPVGAALGEWWDYAAWTEGADQLCLDVTMSRDGYVASAPGVVNLTGESYVLVRCPEIEQHLYRDRAYEAVHAGMGLVKLANYGYREQRYDFTSFPPRRLPTPIGKLGKLTVRLEKGDGTLYDTKGVDHHLVFVIKYLEVNKGPEAMTSTLNPNYTPNPLTYLQKSHVAHGPLPRASRRF